MKQLIKYQTENGSDILIEINETRIKKKVGMSDVGTVEERVDEIVSVAVNTFEKSLDNVYAFGEAIVSKLRNLEPQKVEVEFGISFTANAGAIITSIGGEANFKITLSWEKE